MTQTQPTSDDPGFAPQRPALGYRTGDTATTGSSASGPSAERAVREASDGTVHARERNVLALLADAGPVGYTWAEAGERLQQHHGQITATLSNLHKAGKVAALKKDRRGRSSVYVLPEHVNGRETRAFGGKKDGVMTGTKMHETVEAQMHVYAKDGAPGFDADGNRTVERVEYVTPEPFALTDEEKVLISRIKTGVATALQQRNPAQRVLRFSPESMTVLLAALDRAQGNG